ncbi:MAG: hypothetical protein JWN16_99 [Alphaproteobacteria bacterium]|nr:hypothetical protein [Alphaproteobacteria bacterium]
MPLSATVPAYRPLTTTQEANMAYVDGFGSRCLRTSLHGTRKRRQPFRVLYLTLGDALVELFQLGQLDMGAQFNLVQYVLQRRIGEGFVTARDGRR